VRSKLKTHELLRLTNQLVALSGGHKFGCSPYDVARPKAEEALGLTATEGESKAFLRKNYDQLRAWMDENYPGCPTKQRQIGRVASAVPPPASSAKIKVEVVAPPKAKKPKPPKKTTLGAVISYIKRADVDPQSDAFLSSFAWRATRMMALKKHGAICQCCGASAKTGAVIHVDHIKPRQERPDLALDVDNLQVLCHECNGGKGNWDQTDWRFIPAGRAAELLH